VDLAAEDNCHPLRAQLRDREQVVVQVMAAIDQ
jgi:hypothetical protein